MLGFVLSAILAIAPLAAPAAVAPADTTVSAPSLFGMAKALLGYMSTQATSAEDSTAIGILQQAVGALEAGDRDGAIAPFKEAAAQSLSGAASETGLTVEPALPAGTDTSLVARVNPATFFLNIPAANYSGIAPLAINGLEGDFLLVDDKSATEGFRKVHLSFDDNGQIIAAQDLGFVAASTGATGTDGEGIVYDVRRGTVLIAREASNEIMEFGLDGKATGRYLHTASYFPKNGNAGIESLSYNTENGRFWATTEGCSEGATQLRIQSYAPYFWPLGHWFYTLDKPAFKTKGAIYAYGVSEICALPDGSLLVLEREANIPGTSVKEATGAVVKCKLYRVEPAKTKAGKTLEKHLVTRIDTRALDLSFANYEGMCLGPVLKDGSRVLILVSDSQAGYKGILRDWFKTIVLK